MLDMDLLMVFKDRDTGKITHYMSGGEAGSSGREHFTIEKVINEIQAWKKKGRIIKYYDDGDYNKLRSAKNDSIEDEDDEECTETPLQKRPVAVLDQTLRTSSAGGIDFPLSDAHNF